MARILGLGGIFIKCADPGAYQDWWQTHMGVAISQWGGMVWPNDGQGKTQLSTFARESDYLDPSTERFMINLRVDDVAGMIEKARRGGAQIVGEITDEGYGIFGWFIDPLGIKIELWQAAA